MGIVALVVRSARGSQRPTPSAGQRTMSAIRDAALDLADRAHSVAPDALEASAQARRRRPRQRGADAGVASALSAAQKRAADALARRRSAPEAAESVADTVAETWESLRDQAAPVVDKLKPQIDALATYAKEDPTRAALGVAAAGAIIAGLIALARQSEDDSFR